MWKEIKNAVLNFLELYLLSCFIAFTIAGGILLSLALLPVALLAVLFIVIKQLVSWKKKPANSFVAFEPVFMKKEPAVKVLDDWNDIKEWMNGIRVRWSYYWHDDKFRFNH